MNKSDFFFELPEELIAQSPSERRDGSRLMRLNRNSGEINHNHFYELPDFLSKGDCLVLNNTRVIPARLIGTKKDTGAAVEILLLNDRGNDIWEVLVRPGKKAKSGAEIIFGKDELTAEILETIDGGNRLVKMHYNGIFNEILDRLGAMPLPPYIKRKLDDPERYQTVYSKVRGSAAAPTAGLHFTEELIRKIRDKGISIAYITLHVGLGTFRPVKEENILDHKMHSEQFFVSDETAQVINQTRKNGGRIIAVGTTVCRTLESVAVENGCFAAKSSDTDIFIYPGYKFKAVDALVTNFHLPESTLIMLVSAFAGRENVLAAYNTAVKEHYRFFSFGDAMLIQ